MTSILVDDAGSPIVDSQGELLFAHDITEMKQRIVNILSTPKNSETLNPEYGFDIVTLLTAPPYMDKQQLLISLITDALNPRVNPTISSVVQVQVKIEEQIATCNIEVVGSNGVKYSGIYNMVMA